MFYILNQDNQIAAADYDLLEVLEVDDLQTLFVKVVSGEITFEKLNERKVNIHSKSHFIRAWHEEYVLKSPFGDLKLIKLYNIIVKSNVDTLREKEGFEIPKEESKVLHKPQDEKTQPRNIFAQPSEEKKDLKPKRVSIFLDDDEEPTPSTKEALKDKISDIPNKKVQEDLEFASQRLTETKVDKKPILETLRVQEEPKKEETVVAKPLIQEPKVVKPIVQEEPKIEPIPLEADEVFADDLKLAGINLDTIETDEASIDELLALANEQTQQIHETQTKKVEPEPIESESIEQEILKLDESHEDDKEEGLLDEALLLSDEEPIQEDKSLKRAEIFIEEEPQEIGDLLLVDEVANEQDSVIDQKLSLDDEADMESLLLAVDEAPIEETIKAQPKEEEESFDNLLLLDDEAPAKETPKTQLKEEEESFDDLLLLDDEAPAKETIKAQPKEEEESFDDLLLLDDTPKTPPKEETKKEFNAIKDLLLEIDEEPETQRKVPLKAYNYPDTIEIDLDEHGEMIGLGAEDYQEFLNEFIDKSIIYDEDLRSTDKSKREEALNEIYSISQSLQLPYLEDILADMLERDYLEEELVDIYYDCLAKITTKTKPKIAQTPPPQETPQVKPQESRVHIEEPKTQEAPTVGGYGVLSFEGIKPIHFDFRLEEAAEDLSLPVDLIEEFVNDFIEQAIEEKETFIKAYAKGDMDTIQKTGHKLKGASSNLRIIPLSETLEEIQHCDNPARFEPLLKKYWGQFLSFKLFMENISHK
jgi:hypothetical protein